MDTFPFRIIDKPKLGSNTSSDYFFQSERIFASQHNKPSPYEVWTTPRLKEKVISYAKRLYKTDEPRDWQIRAAIRLYYAWCPQFPVRVARELYKKVGARNVLDFCAGWGDRLAAFLSLEGTISYTGIDCNRDLKKCYDSMLRTFEHNKQVKMIYDYAESCEWRSHKVDTIFTSPPWYKLEKYKNGNNSSSLESWLENFLFKCLRKYLPQCSKTLALHINDYNKVEIMKPLHSFMKAEFEEWIYEGVFEFETKQRIGGKKKDVIHIWKRSV